VENGPSPDADFQSLRLALSPRSFGRELAPTFASPSGLGWPVTHRQASRGQPIDPASRPFTRGGSFLVRCQEVNSSQVVARRRERSPGEPRRSGRAISSTAVASMALA
jgi:hypothetical protein